MDDLATTGSPDILSIVGWGNASLVMSEVMAAHLVAEDWACELAICFEWYFVNVAAVVIIVESLS